MDKDYTTYSADQLLNDDFFIQSELHPTEKSRAFWSDLQIKSAALSQEIENARIFLHTIKIDRNCSSLAAKDEHALWQRIELKNKETERKAKRKQFIRLAISTVASLLLLSAIGWYATLRPKDAETDYLAIIQANPAPDSTNEKVQLVLSNNEKLTIDGTETQLEYKKEGKVNVNSKQVDLSPKGNPAQAQEFNQLIVPVGRRSSITFADGTRLWVNSGSKVVYPVKFAKEKREIFVEGEIYLHVSRDEQKPFIVKTHQMDIKVLGTQFNVTAYENEANMQVVLVSGKVEVNLDKCKNVLAPNQMFSYDSKIHKGKNHNSRYRQLCGLERRILPVPPTAAQRNREKAFPLLRSPYLLQRAGRQIVLQRKTRPERESGRNDESLERSGPDSNRKQI